MKYVETNIVELKSKLEESMISEVGAFLNSYMGGTIYVGVDDGGNILAQSEEERDNNETRIINWIRDEAIYPNCTDYVKISYSEDGVLCIQIEPGDKKPYYIKSKGLKSSGVYIRYGRNKTQATPEEISRMIRETNGMLYESCISKRQDLTFETLANKFRKKGIDFSQFKMITSGFIDEETKKYTNLAFGFSDQYDIDIKMAVYEGMNRSTFKIKQEFTGSIVEQIDEALKFYDLCNEIRIIIDGSPTRTEIPSYKKSAEKEALLNCFCHRDYSMRANIKIEFFDDRCEFLSPGGFYGGLTLEKALEGYQSFRNENLVKLLLT